MPSNSLNIFSSALLFLLWRRRRAGDGRLVTAKELHGDLTTSDLASSFTAIDLRVIKKALRRLEKSGFLESRPVPKDDNTQPGPDPNGYRLPEEGKTITWQSTARIVLELFHHPHPPVEETFFVAEIIRLGLTQEDNDQAMTRDDVVNQIAYCVRKDYVRVDESRDDPTRKIGSRHLHCTPRVDAERSFLERIAVPRRPPIREWDTPSKASDAPDPAVGGSRP